MKIPLLLPRSSAADRPLQAAVSRQDKRRMICAAGRHGYLFGVGVDAGRAGHRHPLGVRRGVAGGTAGGMIQAVVDGNRCQSPGSATVKRSRGIRCCPDGATPACHPGRRGSGSSLSRPLRAAPAVLGPDRVRGDNWRAGATMRTCDSGHESLLETAGMSRSRCPAEPGPGVRQTILFMKYEINP